jgi:hypothetical protein
MLGVKVVGIAVCSSGSEPVVQIPPEDKRRPINGSYRLRFYKF